MNQEWQNWVFTNVVRGAEFEIIYKQLRKEFSDNIIRKSIGDIIFNPKLVGFCRPKLDLTQLWIDHLPVHQNEVELFADVLKQKNFVMEGLSRSDFVRIPNFLSSEVAEQLYSRIYKIKKWQKSSEVDVEQMGNVDFSYQFSYELNEILKNLGILFPNHKMFDLAVSKYKKNDKISEHNDAQGYLQNGVKYCRRYGIMLYLSKDWKEKNGGLFQDLVDKKEYVPKFNTCFVFRVPYSHKISEVVNGSLYSVFGWYAEVYNGQYVLEKDRFAEKN